MKLIQFNDSNDLVSSIEIGKYKYRLRITWNSQGFWTLHLWDKDKNPILCNVKIVPNFPLLMTHHCQNDLIPTGEFLVLSDVDVLDRRSFIDDKASLVYVTKEEWYGSV